MTSSLNLRQRLCHFPRVGRLVWIGLRPQRRVPMVVVSQVRALAELGLEGDRYAVPRDTSRTPRRRQVTLIAAEHLVAMASFLGRETVDPALVRRNLVVEGINVPALRERRFWIGEALFEATGLCHPCSRLEETLGKGGYGAACGHGGLTARVLTTGLLTRGDGVTVVPVTASGEDLGD
ncbi:MAG: MOSC domain-containing protein [Candidatus Competibacterales bacterium]